MSMLETFLVDLEFSWEHEMNIMPPDTIAYYIARPLSGTFINENYQLCKFKRWIPLKLWWLTHWGGVRHICVSKQGHHRSRKWLGAWSAPSHYLNRWWNIVNWTLRNKVQWNCKQNSCIFIQENACENVVWKMAAILSRPQCVKAIHVYGWNMLPAHVHTKWTWTLSPFRNISVWIFLK